MGGGAVISNFFYYNNKLYELNILDCGQLLSGNQGNGLGARFTVTDENDITYDAESMGFTQRVLANGYKDPTSNNTITYKIKVNDTYKENMLQIFTPVNEEYIELKYSNSNETILKTDTVTVELVIEDENGNLIIKAVETCNHPVPFIP